MNRIFITILLLQVGSKAVFALQEPEKKENKSRIVKGYSRGASSKLGKSSRNLKKKTSYQDWGGAGSWGGASPWGEAYSRYKYNGGSYSKYKYKDGGKDGMYPINTPSKKNCDGCLLASLQTYPGRTSTAAEPSGTVEAVFSWFGDLTSFTVNALNLGANCNSASTTGCLVSINIGNSCIEASIIGDFHYKTATNPFTIANKVLYTSDANGQVINNVIPIPSGGNGYDSAKNFGRVVVITDAAGAGLACGVLLNWTETQWYLPGEPWASNSATSTTSWGSGGITWPSIENSWEPGTKKSYKKSKWFYNRV